jgi:hypothetical protein
MELLNSLRRRVLDGIGHADEPCGTPIDSHEHDRLAFAAGTVR